MYYRSLPNTEKAQSFPHPQGQHFRAYPCLSVCHTPEWGHDDRRDSPFVSSDFILVFSRDSSLLVWHAGGSPEDGHRGVSIACCFKWGARVPHQSSEQILDLSSSGVKRRIPSPLDSP